MRASHIKFNTFLFDCLKKTSHYLLSNRVCAFFPSKTELMFFHLYSRLICLSWGSEKALECSSHITPFIRWLSNWTSPSGEVYKLSSGDATAKRYQTQQMHQGQSSWSAAMPGTDRLGCAYVPL